MEWAQTSNEFPHICSAVIVNEQWLVTAASCLHDMRSRRISMFGVGYGINLTTIYSRAPLLPHSVVVHPRHTYNGGSTSNIALIKLADEINLSEYEYVQAACLNDKVGAERRAILHTVGFGATEPVRYDPSTESLSPVVLSNRMRRIQLVQMSSMFESENYGMWARALNIIGGASVGDAGSPLQITRHGKFQAL
jgi:hypothetical protein